MSLISAGKSLGRWRSLLAAAVAVLGIMLVSAPTAAAQTGYSSNDQYKDRSSQYDQYSCPGCEPESASDCPDCGKGAGRYAKEIIGGPGGTAGKDNFSAALEAARSQQGAPPALAAETGTHEDIHGEPAKIGGVGTERDGAGEADTREAANEDGDRSQVRDQEGGPEDGGGSGRSSVAYGLLGGGGAAILGVSIVGTLLMAGFFVSRGSLRG